jgi:hypothetical protein
MSSPQTQGKGSTTKASSSQLKTGKTKEDAKVSDPFWNKLVKHASEVLGASQEMLQKDLDEERKHLNDPKEFKPFVLYVDESFKHLYAAFNYKPDHPPGEPFEFDFHGSEMIEALAILAEGLSKKDFKFIDEIFAKLQKRCDKLFGVAEPTGAEAAEEKKKRIKAYTTLFICFLKAWVICDKLVRAYHDPSSDPDPPKTDPEKSAVKDVREKVEKGEAAKAAIEWIAEVIEALATLIWNPKDRKKLKEWSDELAKDRKDLQESKDSLDKSWKGLGLDKKVKTPSGQAPQPGVKEARIGEWVERLKALAEVLKQSIAVYEAWDAMHPEDIAGTWKVAGFPDAHVVWTLEIGQTSKDTFEATLKGHGKAHPADRRVRETDWFDEDKATAVISREPGGTKLAFRWKPSQSKKSLFPAAGDKFFYGKDELEDEFVKVGDSEIDGPAVAIGQKPDAKAPLKLTRSPQDVAHIFRFAVSLLQLAGALWGVLPEKWRNKILAKALDAAAPVLKPIIGAIQRRVPSLLTQVKLSIDSEGEGEGRKWLISLELAGWQKKVALSASWEILKLLSAALDAFAAQPKQSKEERSALIPRKGSIAVKIRQACELKLEVAPWDGAQKEPAAGKNVDRVVELFGGIDGLQSWKSLTTRKGVTVDVSMPRVRTGKASSSSSLDDVLPAVELPITFYIDDLFALGEQAGAAGGEVPVKLTLVVGLTAAQVASYIPQVRAVLIAWDIGWTIGSFINEIPAVQRGMNSLTDSVARWVNYEGIDDRSVDLVMLASKLAQQRRIPGIEVAVVGAKSFLFAADEWASQHGFQALFREGRHPSFKSIDLQRSRTEADAQQYVKSKKPPGHAWASPGHAMVMARLLGSDLWSAKEIEDQLDADLKANQLHPMQRDLIGFYLLPFDEPHFDSAYKDLADRFRSKHQALGDGALKKIAEAESKKQAAPADAVMIDAWLKMVASPEHKDLVACMVFQPPDPERRDALKIAKGPSGFLWEVWRARANEKLSVDFIVTSRYLTQQRLRFDGVREAVRANYGYHYLNGELSAFADELASERRLEQIEGAQRRGVRFTMRVVGGEATAEPDQRTWFLEVDERGGVLRAFDV